MAYIIPILAIPLIVGFWCLVVKLISLIGGWNRLAQRFKTEARPEGRSFSRQSMRLGIANYSGGLNVVVSPEGLYLSLSFIFRVGHPPLLIPWTEIYDPREETFLFWRHTKITVGKPALATLKLSSAIMDEAQSLLQKQ